MSVAFFSTAWPVVVATTMAIVPVKVTMMVEMEEEEDKKGKMKKSLYSKQVGFVLERENKFFSERK